MVDKITLKMQIVEQQRNEERMSQRVAMNAENSKQIERKNRRYKSISNGGSVFDNSSFGTTYQKQLDKLRQTQDRQDQQLTKTDVSPIRFN